jgi:competence protein ComEC
VVEGFGALPFAKHEIAINGIMVWAYYGILVAILSRKRLGMAMSKSIAWVQERLGRLPQFTYQVPKRAILILLLIATALVWLAVIATPDKQLEVSFLDVGQGDAILIQTPSRQQILVDGGPEPEAISLWLGKKLPFWDKSLDLVVRNNSYRFT